MTPEQIEVAAKKYCELAMFYKFNEGDIERSKKLIIQSFKTTKVQAIIYALTQDKP